MIFRFGAGIRFTYGSAQGCGGKIRVNPGETKSLKSLDFNRDGNYEKELNCQWVFTGADGKNLRMTFSRFNVESAENNTYQNCYDYVEVSYLPNWYNFKIIIFALISVHNLQIGRKLNYLPM